LTGWKISISETAGGEEEQYNGEETGETEAVLEQVKEESVSEEEQENIPDAEINEEQNQDNV